jgi:WD40 repeat protein
MHWVQAVAFTPNPSGTSISDRVTGVVEQSAIAHRLWASGSHDQTIEVWDLTAETRVGQLVGHTSTVWFCGFSADTRSLISASQEGEMHLWEIYTQEALRVIRGDRPYEGMNITAIKGLTPIQKANLKALGAVEW